MTKREKINGELLREDREARNFSREAFLVQIETTTDIRIGVSTLQRAEAGLATRQYLKVIAKTLGFPIKRYLLEDTKESGWHTSFNLNGEWKAFYMEDDVGADAYLATENLYMNHNGSSISGVYEPNSNEHPEGYMGTAAFIMKGVVTENMMMGSFYVDQRSYPRGFGVFQLMLLRNGDWAEGFCTFFADDNRIMCSRNIWVKKSSPEFLIMCKQADKIFKDAKILYKAPFSNQDALS